MCKLDKNQHDNSSLLMNLNAQKLSKIKNKTVIQYRLRREGEYFFLLRQEGLRRRLTRKTYIVYFIIKIENN
ncbi:hypothetical protein BpHYR1_050587 [Brachionus plicatilis]|uniref:Uncharacterized protein n=1 Tax=Brachionus plicatilis TaxID=10195 RepID=A0A3M7S3B8_BRAPC|nr:hypothetical protein BpHYR1_050587 [Brachionus plicatilis]